MNPLGNSPGTTFNSLSVEKTASKSHSSTSREAESPVLLNSSPIHSALLDKGKEEDVSFEQESRIDDRSLRLVSEGKAEEIQYRSEIHGLGMVMENMRSRIPKMREAGIEISRVQSYITTIYHANLTALVNLAEVSLKEKGHFSPIGDQWAMVGLGSLGRGDVNPYSDLDFALLVVEDNDEVRNYFNLLISEIADLTGELKDPGLQLCSGGVVPPYQQGDRDMGTPELIGTPAALNKYAFSRILEADRKAGLSAYSLLQTGYVHGSQKVFTEYSDSQADYYLQSTQGESEKGAIEGASKKKNIFSRMLPKQAKKAEKSESQQPPPETYGMRVGKRILEEGLDFWAERKQLGNLAYTQENLSIEKWNISPQCDIKKSVLRPIQNSVHGLSVFHGIHEPNTYRAINELVKIGFFERSFGAQLTKLYEATNSIRLRIELEGRKEKVVVTRHPSHPICEASGAALLKDDEYQILQRAEELLPELRKKVDSISNLNVG